MKTFYIYILLLTVLAMVSCRNTSGEIDDFIPELEINNDELKEEILKYQQFIRNEQPAGDGSDVTIHVSYMEINDTIDRYVINAYADPEMVRDFDTFQFLCKINGVDVFFHTIGCRSQRKVTPPDFKYHPHFELSEESYLAFVKKYHPHAYQSILQRGSIYPQANYEPDCFYLTFLRGKLIAKEIIPGVPQQKMRVIINGKEFYL